jgi:hypothetical protein
MSKLSDGAMKIQTTKSFDDLMKTYYGVPTAPQLSNTAKVEALLTEYYGRPYKQKKKCPTPARAVSLSLSQDDGELLTQPAQETQFEEYVVQKSAANETFEEYVVTDCRHSDERAVAASLNIEPLGPVNVAQEYEVDVLEPLRPGRATSSRLLPPATPNASYPQTEPGRAYEQSTSSYRPAADETEKAKPSEDDFISDMKSILSGKAVFDPTSGKTVEKDAFAREQSVEPNRGNDRTFPDADKSQAIFDRIAQSMQYANAYDLGTVELENRFADFDRMSDLQQRAKETKKVNKPERRANESTATGAAKVGNEDFIRDMDAIHNTRIVPTNHVARSESLSAAFSAPSKVGEADPACVPFALSLSATDNPADYSRPLYDTGEHVLSGWDLYTDQLRVGKTPGLLFSYGQLIAMADLFESVDQMMKADVTELTTLKALIELSATYYRGKMKGRPDSSMDVSNERWEEATKKRYLKLAEQNYEHFSPAPVFKSLPRITTTKGDNKSAWERHHRSAIDAAQQIYLDPENANRSVFLEWPLIINAFGDHYLTDAFASGHLINKEAMIAYFRSNFFTGRSLKSDANTFFDKVAEKAFTGKVKAEFSKLETEDWKVFPGVHPDIDRPGRFAAVLKAVAEQEPDQIGNLAVKALHDRLNDDGIEVTNNAGSGTWHLYGDGMMDQKSLEIIRKAVQQSVDNINDPAIRASNLNFDTYFEKVWRFIPKLTSSSFQTLERLTGEYINPKSQVLIDGAAQIITEQVDLLVVKLLEAKALRSNKAGWFPNVLSVPEERATPHPPFS